MFIRTKVDTPLGTYYSSVSEDLTDAEFEELENTLSQRLSFFSIVDGNGNTVIFKDGILTNSIITLEEMKFHGDDKR